MLPLKALLRLYRSHPWLLLMSLAGLVLGGIAGGGHRAAQSQCPHQFVAARSQLAGKPTTGWPPLAGWMSSFMCSW